MSFFVDGAHLSSPFRSERRKTEALTYVVPGGSLVDFPRNILPAHSEENIREFGRALAEHTPAATITLLPLITAESLGLSLPEQKDLLADSGYHLFSPYEIAYFAAVWRKEGRGPLFCGRIRTMTEVFGGTSHLNVGCPTVVAYYDQNEMLRFTREYPGCRQRDLGVLAGVQQLL